MREKFPEFFQSSNYKDEFDEKSLIVLDTNVLLNTYRYSTRVQNSLIKAIEKNIDNIFIPYQVALEFVLNKRKVASKIINGEHKIDQQIEERMNMLQATIEDTIQNLETQMKENIQQELINFKKDIENCLNTERLLHCNEEKKSRLNVIEKLDIIFKFDSKLICTKFNYKKKFRQWKTKYLDSYYRLAPKLELKDDYGDRIAELFNGKVGEAFTQKELNKIQEDGKQRYENKIPPGYKDNIKNGEDSKVIYGDLEYEKKYGDLILWKQIIKYLQINEGRYDKVYFITDDIKEDWYHIESGTKIGKKRIGVRYELRKEMLDETSCFLRLKDTNDFIKMALKIDEDLIENKNILNEKNIKIKINKDINKNYQNYLYNELIYNDNNKKADRNVENSIDSIEMDNIDQIDQLYKERIHNDLIKELLRSPVIKKIYFEDYKFRKVIINESDFIIALLREVEFRRIVINDEDFRKILLVERKFRRTLLNDTDFRMIISKDYEFRMVVSKDREFRKILSIYKRFRTYIIKNEEFKNALILSEDFRKNFLTKLKFDEEDKL